MPQSRPLRLALLAFGSVTLAAATAGCASSDRSSSGLFAPYRIDVPQGNYVDQTMLGQVKEGMSRDQVRFALGTPLLVDPFRPDRWDYVFRFQHPSGEADLRRATVFFAEGRVARIEADALPASDEGSDPALPGYRRKQGRFR
ncbi:MAG: outer membrane protein assembly factor BamE [Burkholderiales bacterium]|nr:MAG: outer membrane protein assembly factor BamE [Burkholderiales bacterium]